MTQTAPRSSTSRDRLPRSGARDRGREIRIGVLGVLGIIVLIVGIPAALAVFVGYPLPRTAPSKDWLTVSVTSTLIIKIIACVVWLLWAHFAVCIIAEWRALRRGRMPGDVPFGGGSQMLARRLVASALLLAGAATAFGNLASSSGHHAPPAAVRHVAVQKQHTTAASADSATEQGPVGQAKAGDAAPTKSYTVQPPNGRHYDSLWDIAHRTLGDGMRYKEIYELNKDRIQTDGRKLVDANLIRPGWQLRLPSDAHGAGVHVAHARSTTPEPAAAPATPATAAAHGAGALASPATAAHPSTTHEATAPAAPNQTGGSSWVSDLLGGGLALAGLALALTARRGPYGKAGEDELELTAAADTALAHSLDRALRSLAAARREQGLALPQPVLAWVSAGEVTLALAGGDRSAPPEPWRADSDTTWTCDLTHFVEHPDTDDVAAPFPGLLSVGVDDGQEVFVDFEQAPGLVSVGGDEQRGRDLVTSLAAQAVTCAWSDGARATLVGFSDGEQLAGLDRHRVHHCNALGDVLDDLQRQQDELARLQRSLGLDGVLNGRLSRRSGSWAPHFVILSGAPSAADAERLARLVGDGRSQFVVLVVGDATAAAWRFAIDADRSLDLGVLGATARAHQLDRASMLRIIDALREADRSATAESALVTTLAPQSAVAAAHGVDDASGGAALAVRPERPSRDRATASVLLLGPVAVQAPGELDGDRRALASEIVVAVALAPQGIPAVVLRSAIWPRGVSDDVYEAAMTQAAQWLGADPSGAPALCEVDGRWHLGSSVWIDWEELQAAAQAAQGPVETDALRHGISLFRGEAFCGTPAKHYGWLSFHRAARDAAVVATAVVRRATALSVGAGRLDEAENALRRGLVLVPTAEPLWRDLLMLVGRNGPDAAVAVADEMYDALRAHRVWAQPETDALVAHLAPGRRREVETA